MVKKRDYQRKGPNGNFPYQGNRRFGDQQGANSRDNQQAGRESQQTARDNQQTSRESQQTARDNQQTGRESQHAGNYVKSGYNRQNYHGHSPHGRYNNRTKADETVEDIKDDIARIEKEIDLELKEIKSLKL